MLKLPKDVAKHPKLPAIEAFFASREQPLREASKVMVTHLTYDDTFRKALREAVRTGHLMQGLEQMTKQLDKEKKGLVTMQTKAGQAPAHRLSRLLILASDGSERFYHDAESLLLRHEDRMWGCLVDATSEELGQAFAAKGQPAKAFLIADRKALGMFLVALAEAL